jgi:hypothetical protein
LPSTQRPAPGWGFHFFHLHEVAEEEVDPGPGGWAVCYDMGAEVNDYYVVGIGRQEPQNPCWYEGEGVNWVYEGRKILATTDPLLISVYGIPALTPTQIADFINLHHSHHAT